MARVIIAGSLDFEGKDVASILEGARDMIASAYAEPGCIHYCWTADLLHPGRILVYEEWESSDTLCAHLAAEPYQQMSTYLGTSGMTGADVHKYRVDAKEPVYDPEGRPRGDFFQS